MSEPLHDLTPQPTSDQTPESKAFDAAFDKASDLPFFDLDIALIRRGQQAPVQKTVQPVAQPKPVAIVPAAPPAPEFTRERKALDALEALLAERAAVKPVPEVAQFPKIGPQPASVAKAEPKLIEPRVMPVAPLSQVSAGFVSPGFERVTVAAPVTEAGEPLAALKAGLLQAARDVMVKAPDLSPELKIQLVKQAIARRELSLFTAERPFAAQRPTPQVQPAPHAEAPVSADDLPWGHVTFRLMVM